MGGFLQTSAKPTLQLLSGCLPFFSCLELSPCALRFPYHQLDFAIFASQPIHHADLRRISFRMGVCCFLWYERKCVRGEWRERGEGWGVVVVVVIVVVVCVYMLRNKFLSRGAYRARTLSIRPFLQTWPKKNWQHPDQKDSYNNTHTQHRHTQQTHRHNKAQRHHAGLFPNGVVSFMTPSAPLEKSK